MVLKNGKTLHAGRVAIGLLVATFLGGVLYIGLGTAATHETSASATAAAKTPLVAAQGVARLVSASTETIRLEPSVVASLGIETAAARRSIKGRSLELHGSLALDTNRLVRLHSRFAGEVIELPEIPDHNAERREGRTVLRPIGFGDSVPKGQLLAVVWSKDLGEKKSELADALSQLHYDQEQMVKLTAAAQEGAIPDARLRQQQRSVQADLTAVDRAERTLRVWRVPEQEIEAIRQEAQRIGDRQGKRDPEKEKNWARVEVIAPLDGVVMEKNVSVGDIVDTTSDLLKIADVDSLTVWANAYEESLPALLALPEETRRWTVRVSADAAAPALEGRIEKIGYVSDPAQHTVMVMGRVDNPGGRLRAGQFVTATVSLPASPHEVVVLASAVVEDGRESIVFVQPDPKEPVYSLRRVAIAWRSQKEVYVRSLLRPEDGAKGLQALQPGERVVARAAIQLRSALEDLLASNKAGP